MFCFVFINSKKNHSFKCGFFFVFLRMGDLVFCQKDRAKSGCSGCLPPHFVFLNIKGPEKKPKHFGGIFNAFFLVSPATVADNMSQLKGELIN